jgi:hypothetical protein
MDFSKFNKVDGGFSPVQSRWNWLHYEADMKVRILGDTPAAALLAGLLASEKQDVLFNPGRRLRELKRTREIRVILPWGWVRTTSFALSSSTAVRPGELGVVAGCGALQEARKPGGSATGIGGKSSSLLLLDCDLEAHSGLLPEKPAVLRGLTLMEAQQWDPGTVEVSSSKPWLILQADPRLRELSRCLKAAHLGVLEVQDVSPYLNSLHIWNLLRLPVAMCHSTLGNFLSYEEGREIARYVLEEGFELFSHKELPLGKLPVMDPRSLLQKLQKKPQEFGSLRNLPDRAYGAALQDLLHGDRKRARAPNDRLVRMSAQTGIDPWWNWSLTKKLSRVPGVGFFRDPVELYRAIT